MTGTMDKPFYDDNVRAGMDELKRSPERDEIRGATSGELRTYLDNVDTTVDSNQEPGYVDTGRTLNRRQRRAQERQARLRARRQERQRRVEEARLTTEIRAAYLPHIDAVVVTRRSDLHPDDAYWLSGGEPGSMETRWYLSQSRGAESVVVERFRERGPDDVGHLAVYVAAGIGTISSEIARLITDALAVEG